MKSIENLSTVGVQGLVLLGRSQLNRPPSYWHGCRDYNFQVIDISPDHPVFLTLRRAHRRPISSAACHVPFSVTMATPIDVEPFPELTPTTSLNFRGGEGDVHRRRKSSNLRGDPRGDTATPSLATLYDQSPTATGTSSPVRLLS